MAWVHTHVGDNGSDFSSLDNHMQYSLQKVFPHILGLVIKVNDNFEDLKFQRLTTLGMEHIKRCDDIFEGAFSNELHDVCGPTGPAGNRGAQGRPGVTPQ